MQGAERGKLICGHLAAIVNNGRLSGLQLNRTFASFVKRFLAFSHIMLAIVFAYGLTKVPHRRYVDVKKRKCSNLVRVDERHVV